LGEWQLRIGGFDLDHVSRRLSDFAAEYGAGGRAQRFVLADDALVEESAVLADAPLVMRLIQRHRRLVTLDLPFTATRIVARSNIRVLGLGPRADRTARIQMRQGSGSIRRDVRARRTIAAIRARRPVPEKPEVEIPAILKIGRDWLVEEQIAALHPGAGEVRAFTENWLPAFYRHTLRPRPYRGPASLRALAEEAARRLPGFSMRGQPDLWPVALCKGDLNSSNLLSAPGPRFWMIDWELAGVMAIAIDLAAVCYEVPSLMDVSLDLLRQLSPAGCVAPEIQLTLGFAGMALRFAAERSAPLRRSSGDGPSAVGMGEWHARRDARIQTLMQSVFGV
jgi:hypothetical protein